MFNEWMNKLSRRRQLGRRFSIKFTMVKVSLSLLLQERRFNLLALFF